jgi:peptidyl-prolyl cis-trans isomerase A (cyclophilin A)
VRRAALAAFVLAASPLAALLLVLACGRAPGPYAVLETSKGRMVARLYADRAPRTIAHIKALANRPLYDGTLFHRVIPGLLIQGGDPTGTGEGNPHLSVPDEGLAASRFDKAGLLAMASWGPGTSQTQFFITLGPARDLDGQYTIFGELVEGLDVAKAIAAVPRDEKSGSDRPFDPPVLKSFRVVASHP